MNNEKQLDDIFEILRTRVPSSPDQTQLRSVFLEKAQLMATDQSIPHQNEWVVALFRKRFNPLNKRKWLPTMSFLTLIMLIVGIVVAQQIFDFFQQSKDDQQAIPIRFGSGGQIVNTPITLEEAIQLVDFDVAIPTLLPKGYQPREVFYWDVQEGIAIHYQCGSFRKLIFAQMPMSAAEAANLDLRVVGASANIESVTIGNTIGQFVRGTWIVTDNINALAATAIPGTPIPAHSEWENNSELQRLHWHENDMFYVLSNIGSSIDVGTAGECSLDKGDFAAVANSLNQMGDNEQK